MQARVASVAVVVAVAACVVVGALALILGWGSSLPQSPEALFGKLCEYQLAGETGKMWDLLTDDARQENSKGFAAHRKVIAQDPNEKLTSQFNCTREEFMRMSDVQIFCSENKGKERVLVGAKIVDRQTDPRAPDDAFLMADVPTGFRVTLHARHVEGGWLWVGPLHWRQLR